MMLLMAVSLRTKVAPSMFQPCRKKMNKPVLARVDEICSAAVQAGNPIVCATL
jgi:hypothetical protein